MSANDVENIVDNTVRRLVQTKLEQIGDFPKGMTPFAILMRALWIKTLRPSPAVR